MQQFKKTKLFKVFLITGIFGLLVFLNPKSFFNPVRRGFLFITYPLQKTGYSFSASFVGLRDFLDSIGQLKTENEKLLAQNQQLISENARLHDIEKENVILRDQIGLLPRERFQFEAAGVIGQDPSGLGNWIEINKGSNAGIKEGMAVVVSKGILIGKIQEVNLNSSQVILLTNSKSTVNVMTSQNGAKGVIKGRYGLGIIFDMIMQTDSVNIGDEVITSGISGVVPRGLFVGTVQEVHPSEDHLFQQAVVSTPAQISKLQFVFVIKQNL